MALRYYILDDNNQPVQVEDGLEAYMWHHKNFQEKCIVAKTPIGDDIEVSTVFLVLDHNHDRNNPNAVPVVFETMVFGGEMSDECERYSSWIEAKKGHANMVEKVKRSLEKK